MSYVFECYHVAVFVQDLGMRALPGMLLDFCSQSDGADCGSPSSQDRPVDDAGAGRRAGRSLQAKLAMAALGEPDASAATLGTHLAAGEEPFAAASEGNAEQLPDSPA